MNKDNKTIFDQFAASRQQILSEQPEGPPTLPHPREYYSKEQLDTFDLKLAEWEADNAEKEMSQRTANATTNTGQWSQGGQASNPNIAAFKKRQAEIAKTRNDPGFQNHVKSIMSAQDGQSGDNAFDVHKAAQEFYANNPDQVPPGYDNSTNTAGGDFEGATELPQGRTGEDSAYERDSFEIDRERMSDEELMAAYPQFFKDTGETEQDRKEREDYMSRVQGDLDREAEDARIDADRQAKFDAYNRGELEPGETLDPDPVDTEFGNNFEQDPFEELPDVNPAHADIAVEPADVAGGTFPSTKSSSRVPSPGTAQSSSPDPRGIPFAGMEKEPNPASGVGAVPGAGGADEPGFDITNNPPGWLTQSSDGGLSDEDLTDTGKAGDKEALAGLGNAIDKADISGVVSPGQTAPGLPSGEFDPNEFSPAAPTPSIPSIPTPTPDTADLDAATQIAQSRTQSGNEAAARAAKAANQPQPPASPEEEEGDFGDGRTAEPLAGSIKTFPKNVAAANLVPAKKPVTPRKIQSPAPEEQGMPPVDSSEAPMGLDANGDPIVPEAEPEKKSTHPLPPSVRPPTPQKSWGTKAMDWVKSSQFDDTLNNVGRVPDDTIINPDPDNALSRPMLNPYATRNELPATADEPAPEFSNVNDAPEKKTRMQRRFDRKAGKANSRELLKARNARELEEYKKELKNMTTDEIRVALRYELDRGRNSSIHASPGRGDRRNQPRPGRGDRKARRQARRQESEAPAETSAIPEPTSTTLNRNVPAEKPEKNSLGDWFKSLAPGGARPGDTLPGREKTTADPNRPAFMGAKTWEKRKAAGTAGQRSTPPHQRKANFRKSRVPAKPANAPTSTTLNRNVPTANNAPAQRNGALGQQANAQLQKDNAAIAKAAADEAKDASIAKQAGKPAKSPGKFKNFFSGFKVDKSKPGAARIN